MTVLEFSSAVVRPEREAVGAVVVRGGRVRPGAVRVDRRAAVRRACDLAVGQRAIVDVGAGDGARLVRVLVASAGVARARGGVVHRVDRDRDGRRVRTIRADRREVERVCAVVVGGRRVQDVRVAAVGAAGIAGDRSRCPDRAVGGGGRRELRDGQSVALIACRERDRHGRVLVGGRGPGRGLGRAEDGHGQGGGERGARPATSSGFGARWNLGLRTLGDRLGYRVTATRARDNEADDV